MLISFYYEVCWRVLMDQLHVIMVVNTYEQGLEGIAVIIHGYFTYVNYLDYIIEGSSMSNVAKGRKPCKGSNHQKLSRKGSSEVE